MVEDPQAATALTADDSAKSIKLRSLAPEYNGDHHAIYVRHLEDAVTEKKNRNIALTGRYGAGKSSVLDEFEKKHARKTVRISMNTLGPDDADEDLTNRIQKELVKQLVFRLKPGRMRGSKVARRNPLTKWRALRQALAVSALGVGLMWLLGVRPPSNWAGAQWSDAGQAALVLAFFALVVVVVWGTRLAIGDRIVSQVTTAGTSIALGEGPSTYFDSFLEEIVAFFDSVRPEFVIFEDLDRFDDPQIFESLRELNTLVNASARWKRSSKPLRFIYAIKDSLFEQIGAEARAPEDGSVEVRLDLAAEAVRRANRTKFFEIVIPIVPFLSHRNARDHLADALTELGFEKDFVSRPLLDLVARHTTDMRLMKNICNEFVVFTERLLWNENPGPGMKPDHLFALVVYKNFHMGDFENIAQRTSTLDVLERHHRDEVRALIEGLQMQRRASTHLEEHRRRREETAAMLGSRFQAMKSMFPSRYNYPLTVDVGDRAFSWDQVESVDFWAQVAAVRSLRVHQQNTGDTAVSSEMLAELFPELSSAYHWLEPSPEALGLALQRADEDIAMLRGADFAELAKYERVPEGRTMFDQHITDDLHSELARDLVRQGFITRNYAEYSAIFYGSFVGVDVAYFYNHSVQPNEMYLDFTFTSQHAVGNLLEQVPSDFTSTVSALNVDVVDFLLAHNPDGAKAITAYIASHEASDDVQTFLDAYFNTLEAQREALVRALTVHPWRSTFTHITGHPGIPDEKTRLQLLDAALLSALPVDRYELDDAVAELLQTRHPQLQAIRADHDPAQIARVFEILEAVHIVVPDLGNLSKKLRERVVDAHMYEITVPNLKLALPTGNAPTLDEVRKSKSVWEYCRSHINAYLTATHMDETTKRVVQSEQVLVEIINEQQESWTDEQLEAIIDRSVAGVLVADLTEVPERIWPMLLKSRHVSPSALNVADYIGAHGVDEEIGELLSPRGGPVLELVGIDEVDDDKLADLVVELLNASEYLTAEARVALAGQVTPPDGFELSEVSPSADQLFARGLEAGLFTDEADSFAHFAQGGWHAVSEAFESSSNIERFMSPVIVQGFVADVLGSVKISKDLKRRIVDDLAGYVPEDEARALRAAGEFARTESIKLPLDEVRRIARVTKTASAVMRQLVLSSKDLTSDETVEILVSLGAPYAKLADGPGTKFDLPAGGSSLSTVFAYLKETGRIKITKNLMGRGKIVEVLS